LALRAALQEHGVALKDRTVDGTVQLVDAPHVTEPKVVEHAVYPVEQNLGVIERLEAGFHD